MNPLLDRVSQARFLSGISNLRGQGSTRSARATGTTPDRSNYGLNAGGGSWGATTVAICRQTGSTALLPTSGL